MPTVEFRRAKAHQTYRLKDGTIVPSATTVISVLGFNKEALIRWANGLGLQGIDALKYRDETASAGSCAHEIIRGWFIGEEPDLSAYSAEQIAAAQRALDSFKRWVARRKLEPILCEQPLVSERYRFGGTVEWYGLINGTPTLCDFKTSSQIHLEHRIQVAAYRQLLIENGYPVRAIRLIRVGREPGDDFEEHVIRRVGDYWRMFLHARALYDLKRKVERSA